MVEMARFVKPILNMTPPDPMSLEAARSAEAAVPRHALPQLAAGDRYNQVQLMTMSAVDFLDQWFETDVLKATMSASGIIGTFLGVRSPGTAYVLLHHYMGEIDGAFRSWGFARGGTGAISNAIAAAAREAGVEIRTKASVAKHHARSTGAQPASSSRTATRSADIVLVERRSASHVLEVRRPRASADDFVDDVLALQVPRIVRQGESRARRTAGLHLPAGRRAASAWRDLDLTERRLHGARVRRCEVRRFSRRPYIDIVIPTLTDPSVAPPGKHVLSCFVQYAPYTCATGTWDEEREAFGDTVVDTIAEYAPNI